MAIIQNFHCFRRFYLFVYIAQKSIKWGKNNFYKRFYGQKVMKIGHFYECILMNNSEYFS